MPFQILPHITWQSTWADGLSELLEKERDIFQQFLRGRASAEEVKARRPLWDQTNSSSSLEFAHMVGNQKHLVSLHGQENNNFPPL